MIHLQAEQGWNLVACHDEEILPGFNAVVFCDSSTKLASVKAYLDHASVLSSLLLLGGPMKIASTSYGLRHIELNRCLTSLEHHLKASRLEHPIAAAPSEV